MNRVLLIAVTLLITGLQFAVADEWPTKPIRIVESFPAGVARDVRTRVVADRLSKVLGQQVLSRTGRALQDASPRPPPHPRLPRAPPSS